MMWVMVRLFWEMRVRRWSAEVVLRRLVAGSKSRTESIIAACLVMGSATMYCHVPVTGSKQVWIIGVMGS